ncbi:MAG: bifunctional proline dehydrogenase/L-glutamate gamma-semialdehyde dehydrogenase [Buchananella hordeovulneris]|nr:bifunctional proline dehydrogenase/L-glutamate gamma-semialdehyde dehydrogenase [Buchananella hordeovulneris]
MSAPSVPAHLAAIDLAVQTARRWAKASANYPEDRAARLLADALSSEGGLDFTVGFVDGVVRTEDLGVAGRNLARLMRQRPDFLPAWLGLPASAGGKLATLAPSVVVPMARRVFQTMVGDLVVDVTDRKLGAAIQRLSAGGARLNINLLGEAVLGEKEAARRLKAVEELLHRPDVDYVSLKVSAISGPHNPWGFDEVVAEAVERVAHLYSYAANESAAGRPKFINLDMEEYRDLDLTIEVFTRLLDRPEHLHLEAGIVLQTYLPDALPAMQRLQEWAAARRARGGAGIKVRVVKGANLAMERVEAAVHGWELATWPSKAHTDANYMRVLDWALTPERTKNVRLGVAGHNLFTLAYAWELAGLRGVRDGMEVEMLSGMATQQAEAVRAEVGNLLLYVPVVRPQEYDVAIAYLVRRLEENSAPENFMSSSFTISEDHSFGDQADRFKQAAHFFLPGYPGEGEERGYEQCVPTRTQDRSAETRQSLAAAAGAEHGWPFANTADTDPALPANRKWAKEIMARVPTSQVGVAGVEAARVETNDALENVISTAIEAGREWSQRSAKERAEILHRVGVELAARRGEMIEVAAAELGKALDQTDVEVSEAIDFAHYYATQAVAMAERMEKDGASFHPAALTVVTPPWNFPLAIPFGGVAAALAAGSPAILKPAPSAVRCGAVLIEAMHAAGVPAQVAQLVVPDAERGEWLVRDPRVERVVLTGAAHTARLFKSWRPDLDLLAETSGKNAIIVTPAADLDLAVKDVVYSAFGHAGQKCSASSLVILVGSVARSRRFRDQLVDAVSSLRIDWPANPMAQMGPLSVPLTDKLRWGLTRLDGGQRWVIEPRSLDETGRLWSPGVRSGVRPGSEYHLVEYFGPILGVVAVETLEEAIAVQNGTEYGLTAGLHSLDAEEINYWLEHVQAGNLYVNRGITGAIVQRQPFGGWKRSTVGTTFKAGGPNYLYGFGAVEVDLAASLAPAEVSGLKPQLAALVDAAARAGFPAAEVEALGAHCERLSAACAQEFDVLHDPTGLAAERNYLRYLPAPASIRVEEGVSHFELLAVLAASLAVGDFDMPEHSTVASARARSAAGSEHAEQLLEVSVAQEVPGELRAFLARYGATVHVEPHSAYVSRLRGRLALAGAPAGSGSAEGLDVRVRLRGAGAAQLQAELRGSIDLAVWDGPVTAHARAEILPFVREQAVSITNHRFGNSTPLSKQVLTGVPVKG